MGIYRDDEKCGCVYITTTYDYPPSREIVPQNGKLLCIQIVDEYDLESYSI
jgi:hypothetical protein